MFRRLRKLRHSTCPPQGSVPHNPMGCLRARRGCATIGCRSPAHHYRISGVFSPRCPLATFTQTDRLLRLKTPLGPDALLITQLHGREALSQLYTYDLSLLAPVEKTIDFDKLLGQPVSIELDSEKKTRYFHGIVNRFAQGRRDDTFVHYHMEVVPQLWLLTRVVQSRIFQQISVPDILKKVLKGLKVSFDIQGSFEARD